MNTHVFHWPDHIKNVFEIAQKIILSKRDSIEDELKSRVAKFEEKLNDMMKEVESFKKKEVSLAFQKYERTKFIQIIYVNFVMSVKE